MFSRSSKKAVLDVDGHWRLTSMIRDALPGAGLPASDASFGATTARMQPTIPRIGRHAGLIAPLRGLTQLAPAPALVS